METRKKQECFLCAVPVKSRPDCSVVEKTDDTREWEANKKKSPVTGTEVLDPGNIC